MKVIYHLVIVIFCAMTSCSKGEPALASKSEFAGEWDGYMVYPTKFSPYTINAFVKVNESGELTGTFENYNLEYKIMGKVYANGIWNANISGYGDKGNISGLTYDKKLFKGSFFYTDLSSDVYEGTILLTKK